MDLTDGTANSSPAGQAAHANKAEGAISVTNSSCILEKQDLARPTTVERGVPTKPSNSGISMAWRSGSWQTAASAIFLLFAGAIAVWQWPSITVGLERLESADKRWLFLGVLGSIAAWISSALALQGAVVESLPSRRLVLSQIAASGANQILPSGLGASAVTLRFLTLQGISLPYAATAVMMKNLAGGATRCFLVMGLWFAYPEAIRLPSPPSIWILIPFVGIFFLGIFLVIISLRRGVKPTMTQLKTVHRMPTRIATLWGGSVSFNLFQASILVTVTLALGMPLNVATVVLVALAASGAAALVPTPGGIGTLDAALTAALTFAGASVNDAATAVIGYRLLTVWLPITPQLILLVVLLRRKVI
ncbi:YbhN family protein [Streptomyces sp. NPDC088847]|uniref:lysylphosphatidylglycerol synthase transmembrane domain-containing protein n=1 Tax=Streptomyces sp. NPDC088847 TaxID=3365909 RepID=UPI00380874D1